MELPASSIMAAAAALSGSPGMAPRRLLASYCSCSPRRASASLLV